MCSQDKENDSAEIDKIYFYFKDKCLLELCNEQFKQKRVHVSQDKLP